MTSLRHCIALQMQWITAMPEVARIIGGAGTGKTTFLLEKMERALEVGGYRPEQIGFVSFTRAARAEAAERAAAKFNVGVKDLEQHGWFRTIHSAVYRLLRGQCGELLTDTAEDRRWLQEHLGEPISHVEGEETGEPFSRKSDAEIALSMWSAARNRLLPLRDLHERAKACDERTPDFAYCREVVEKYQQAKRLQGRTDFTDLIGLYAGYWFHVDGPTRVTPSGEVPDVPVWYLDEQQDTSALLDAACRRITSNARWVYMCLDPFQSIYGWAGASAAHAMAWEVQKQHVLPQSHRCPRTVHELGEKILSQCSDYWDRKIAPANREGEILEFRQFDESWPYLIDPKDSASWLLIARTNYSAQQLAGRMDGMGFPWLPTKQGGCRWDAPVRNKAIRALQALTDGYPISVDEWQAVLKTVTQSGMFTRGTKKRWEEYTDDMNILADRTTLSEWGATEQLLGMLTGPFWHRLINFAGEYTAAWKQHGPEAVLEPRVRVGTVHSVKGAEADNVVLFTATSPQIGKGMEFPDQADEERRIAYVGVTRARQRLIIVRPNGSDPYQMKGIDL
jgi:DNA helicase-2/ATP-dependent DNA helicase PcrA